MVGVLSLPAHMAVSKMVTKDILVVVQEDTGTSKVDLKTIRYLLVVLEFVRFTELTRFTT